MRQLGDFATWLGLILLVLGVIFYTPRLVEYINDDVAARPQGPAIVGRSTGHAPSRRHMAMHRARAESLPRGHAD